jgi:hypothetical protein
MSYSVLPGLVGSFTQSKKGTISLNLALFILNIYFEHFSSALMLEFILLTLFGGKLSR